jgi:hypothetical protein
MRCNRLLIAGRRTAAVALPAISQSSLDCLRRTAGLRGLPR